MTDNTTDTAKEADPAETTIEQPIIDDTIITAGSLARGLKKCREEADMDVKQAANEMRLPLAVLKALEAENFTDLPEPPYIRGYLRSYSRLNDSDPNDLIRRYEVLRGADPDDVASFTPSMPLNRVTNKPTVSPGTVKLAGLALIVLLLGVLSMIPAVSQWATDTWQSFSQKTAETQSNGEAQTAEQTDSEAAVNESESAGDTTNLASSNNDTAANSGNTGQLALNDQANDNTEKAASEENKPATTGDDNPEKAPETSSETSETETATDEKTAEAATETETTDKPADTEQTQIAEADKQPENDAAAKEAEAAAAAKKAEEEAEAQKLAEQKQKEQAEAATKLAEEEKVAEEAKKLAAAEAAKKAEQDQQKQAEEKFQQPIDGTVMIRLNFTESVWMSIKDGKGKSIFSSLNAPGSRKELKARTPLSFKVGNAPGVKIYLNGQLVDQAPYSRGSVAQFTVK